MGKVRIQNALIAVGVIAASFPSVTVFSRTSTAKEAGLAHACASCFRRVEDRQTIKATVNA
ncbi:MAG: hypothetical protein WA733_10935 [Methylocystis sp.]